MCAVLIINNLWKGYLFKELSQLFSPGVPRAHGLLRSHHGAHTPALTVLCWAVHLPRLLRVRRQHLVIEDNTQTDNWGQWEKLYTNGSVPSAYKRKMHSPGTAGCLQSIFLYFSGQIYAHTKNTARHFTYVITLGLCHKIWTLFPKRVARTNEGLSHIYSSQLHGSEDFTCYVLIHNHFFLK